MFNENPNLTEWEQVAFSSDQSLLQQNSFFDSTVTGRVGTGACSCPPSFILALLTRPLQDKKNNSLFKSKKTQKRKTINVLADRRLATGVTFTYGWRDRLLALQSYLKCKII